MRGKASLFVNRFRPAHAYAGVGVGVAARKRHRCCIPTTRIIYLDWDSNPDRASLIDRYYGELLRLVCCSENEEIIKADQMVLGYLPSVKERRKHERLLDNTHGTGRLPMNFPSESRTYQQFVGLNTTDGRTQPAFMRILHYEHPHSCKQTEYCT